MTNRLLHPWEDTTIGDISVRNAKVSHAFIFDIPDIIDAWAHSVKYIWNKTIYPLSGWLFLLEYVDIVDRDADAKIFREVFQKEWFFAQELPEGYQIPENAGEFEYNGKYFLILNSYNKQIDTNDSFSIQWVILDIPSYNLSRTTQETVKSIVRPA